MFTSTCLLGHLFFAVWSWFLISLTTPLPFDSKRKEEVIITVTALALP